MGTDRGGIEMKEENDTKPKNGVKVNSDRGGRGYLYIFSMAYYGGILRGIGGASWRNCV